MSISDYINFYVPLTYKSKENFFNFFDLYFYIFFLFFIFDDKYEIFTNIEDNSPLEKIKLKNSYIIIGLVDINRIQMI